MNASLRVRIAAMTLIAASMLCLSGCMTMASRQEHYMGQPWGDPPYLGVKCTIKVIMGSYEDKEDMPWWLPLCHKAVFIPDLPLTFLLDTVLLPVDLAAMSKDPVYHGQVLHGVTGEPMRNVVVLAGDTSLRGASLSMLADSKGCPRRTGESPP